ncbi:hypothetical protein GCM10009850_004670 [Nonomuraea monospora]|uniref:Uncharacterized protein n=1 Tax=Nonomuraea monospora TaxID=568818 RepID=A0ABN3C6B5_9ACTN
MSPMVGIDPALMTRLINGLRRVSGLIPELDLQVERALTSLGLRVWGPSALPAIAREMNARIPALQGRLDLILAEPDRRPGSDGLLWADESAWLSKSPDEGAATAARLARLLRAEIPDHALDAETVAQLELHKNDPYFALAFFGQIPPAELKLLINQAYGSDLPPSERPLQRDAATPDRLLTMLSTLLGTASRGVGRTRPGDDYAARLVEGVEDRRQAFAVKRLLMDGEFEPSFLLAVVRRLYDADLAHPPDLSLPRDAWTMPGARDALPGDLSPMGAALVALAHHPAVAQDFLTDPERRPLDYLMRRHVWEGEADGDLGWAIEVAATEIRDHEVPVGGSRGYKSALIASWAVRFWSGAKVQANLPNTRANLGNVLAQYTGDVHRTTRAFSEEMAGVMADQDADKNLRGAEPYGALFDANGVKRAMTWAFEDEGAFRTVVAAHGMYAGRMLDEVAGKIAIEVRADFAEWRKSHPGATPEQLDAARQDLLEECMSRGGGSEFTRATRDLSRTTWLITDAANISDIAAAKATDARFATFKAMTEKVAGLAPGPQGKFFGLLVDEAKSLIFGTMKSNHEETARTDADSATGLAKHMFADLTAATMMRHDLFGDGSVPAATHPYKHKDFSPGSDGHFLVDGRIKPWAEMTAEERRSYDEWLSLNETGRVFGPPGEAIEIGFESAEKYYSQSGS